jgi:hypothetical protein
MSIGCPQAEGTSSMNTADVMTIVNQLRAEVIRILLPMERSLEYRPNRISVGTR